MRKTTKEYIPVPVLAAKAIGEDFEKHVVVVLAWDEAYNLLHTATWGASALQKSQAAALGEVCASAAFTDMSKKKTYEDFRDIPAAEYVAKIEGLEKEIKRLKGRKRPCPKK